ncbi:MAG: hypothetical protein HY696_04700 [Deltaproteobacteria bacterium]|nr:hypothetical protein [Deltaproteobacteria bacterium]
MTNRVVQSCLALWLLIVSISTVAGAAGFRGRCQGGDGHAHICRMQFQNGRLEIRHDAFAEPLAIDRSKVVRVTLAPAAATASPSVVSVPNVRLPETSAQVPAPSSNPNANAGTVYVPTTPPADPVRQFGVTYLDAQGNRQGILIQIPAAETAGLKLQLETLTGHPVIEE